MSARADLLQGSLDLLILKSVALGPLHGWAISKRINQLSSDVLQVNQGSLYPALYRLEDRAWIVAAWDKSPEGRDVNGAICRPVTARRGNAPWRRDRFPTAPS